MKRRPRSFATLASGLKLHYQIHGPTEIEEKSSAQWIICLNGLFSDTTLWAGALPVLTRKHRLLCFDFQGQGASDVGALDPCTPVMLAAQAKELMGMLGVERPWLLGLSNGSNVALELLAEHSEAFRGAVLCSSMPGMDFATRLKIRHWIQCLDVGGPLMQFDAAAPFLWGDRFLQARYGLIRAFQHTLMERDPGIYAGARAQMEGLLEWEPGDRLSAIRSKMLLLSGAEDLLTPPWKCLETAKRISHSRFEIVPHVGHAYPVEEARSYSIRVVDFIDDSDWDG